MVSPDEASEMACPMVLQAVWRVLQSLLSLPFTPSTYQVVLARAVEAKVRSRAMAVVHSVLHFIASPHQFCCQLVSWIDGARNVKSIILEPERGRRLWLGCFVHGRRFWRCGTRLYHAVVAAFDAGMILVARDQQESMPAQVEIIT